MEGPPSRTSPWLIVVVGVLFVAVILSFGYGYRQHEAMAQLAGQDQQLTAQMDQLRAQLEAVTTKLQTLPTPPAAAPPTDTRAAAARRRADERRLKQLQSRLDEQQKKLSENTEEIAKARADLEGRIGTTRDELNGSIARTHEELVALEKRGERNYFEFDLPKGKSFQRVGPISLSLRKTDVKNRRYHLAFLVDDNTMSKSAINLYEPVWIHRADDPQPIQVVVNKIEKNRVHGYVSVPKYRQSELAARAAQQPANATQKPADTPPY
jgi:ElaB/YqjD/DUF883 family membrane-anchored ribosome-binding protein